MLTYEKIEHQQRIINRLSKKIQRLKRENKVTSNNLCSQLDMEKYFKFTAYEYLMKVEDIYNKYSNKDYSEYDSDNILSELSLLISELNKGGNNE